MALVEWDDVFFEDLLDRVLKVLTDFCGFILLLTKTSYDFNELIPMELSFCTILVWVITIVCLNEGSIDRSKINSLIKQLAPMTEDSKVIETHARILGCTGDMEEDILDSHVVFEKHLFDGLGILLFLGHTADLSVGHILLKHFLEVVIRIFHESFPDGLLFDEDCLFGNIVFTIQCNLLELADSLFDHDLVEEYVGTLESDNVIFRRQENMLLFIDEIEEMFAWRNEISEHNLILLFLFTFDYVGLLRDLLFFKPFDELPLLGLLRLAFEIGMHLNGLPVSETGNQEDVDSSELILLVFHPVLV